MIYIYNRDEIQIDSLDIEPKFTEEIGKLRTLEFESEKKYEKGYRVVTLIDNIAYEFVIIDTEYSRDNIIENSYFCQDSLIELQAIPIMDLRPQGGIDKALSSILKDTRWKFELINGYNSNQSSKNSFYHISALEAFSEIVETYRSEWITEYRFSGSKITERKILIYQRDGRSKGRLEFGKNIVKFKRKILSEPIITAIIPFGKGEEKESGAFGRRIGIEDINGGIPYIENKVATKIYGIGDKKNKLPLFGFLTLEDITDPHELKKLAQEELDIVSQPRAEYVVDAIDLDIEAKIGYEVPTIDDEIGYRSYSRIKKIVREGKDIKLTFGSVTKKFTDSFQKEIKNTKKEFNNVYEQLNHQMESADGKTTVYTGASKPNNPSNGDMWYRENTDGSVDMLFYKDGEWTERISERLFKEFREKMDENSNLIKEAEEKVDQAEKSLVDIRADIESLGDLSQSLSKLNEAQESIGNLENDISSIMGQISADFYDKAPTPPYDLKQKWYKIHYTPSKEIDQGYDILSNDDRITLDEFANPGLFICIKARKKGEKFSWNDWKRIATDNTSLIEQQANLAEKGLLELKNGLVDYAKNSDVEKLMYTEQIKTDKKISDILLDYSKTNEIQKYAITVAEKEAGKVSRQLSEYVKTNDLNDRGYSTTEYVNSSISTVNNNISSLNKKINGQDVKLNVLTETVDGNNRVIADLEGKTGNTSISTIRNMINEHSTTLRNLPENITEFANIKNETPVPPYKIGCVWFKDVYNLENEDYDVISREDKVSLGELSDSGTWICIKTKKKGEKFSWSDWKRVSSDNEGLISQIYQDINTVQLSVIDYSKEIGSKIKLLSDTMNLEVSDIRANFTSQLNILRNQVDISVKKGDLLGEINTQAGNVLIKASNGTNKSILNITSKGTYIENGLIKTAHISTAAITDALLKNVTFDWAVGKTLDAKKINVVNLDANKIVTGTLSASMIKGGTLDARYINVKNLNANAIKSGIISGKNGEWNLDEGIFRFRTGGSELSVLHASLLFYYNDKLRAIHDNSGLIFYNTDGEWSGGFLNSYLDNGQFTIKMFHEASKNNISLGFNDEEGNYHTYLILDRYNTSRKLSKSHYPIQFQYETYFTKDIFINDSIYFNNDFKIKTTNVNSTKGIEISDFGGDGLRVVWDGIYHTSFGTSYKLATEEDLDEVRNDLEDTRKSLNDMINAWNDYVG